MIAKSWRNFRRKWKIFKEGKRNTKRGIGLGFIVQSKQRERERERELTDLQFIEEGHFGDKGFVWGWFRLLISGRNLSENSSRHSYKQTKRPSTPLKRSDSDRFEMTNLAFWFPHYSQSRHTIAAELVTHNYNLQRRWDGSYRFDSATPHKIESGTLTRLEAMNIYIMVKFELH